MRSGVPFNITTGGDNNADLMFTDRPALATDLNDPNVIATRFGVFDPTPEPGTPVIARNFGEGPSYSAINFRISRTFGLGKKTAASTDASGDRRPGDGIMIGGPRHRRRGGRRGRGGPFFGGGSSEHRYSLTFSPLRSEPFQHNQPGRADRKLNLTAVWTIQRLSRLWAGVARAPGTVQSACRCASVSE